MESTVCVLYKPMLSVGYVNSLPGSFLKSLQPGRQYNLQSTMAAQLKVKSDRIVLTQTVNTYTM
jgi:hypothetical protein